jgi:hypothetical protein
LVCRSVGGRASEGVTLSDVRYEVSVVMRPSPEVPSIVVAGHDGR